MAKKPEKPIADYNEYKRRQRKVKIITALAIVVPSLLIIGAFSILFTGGKVLTIFGVKNYRVAMDVFYIVFYVLVGIVIVIILIYAIFFLVKTIIEYIKELKNK